MRKTLSVFYIVQNEQDYIYKSMKSIEKISDEIIVVDSGSIDRTIEICKTFNAKIYKYKWNNNFAEARNFALEKCTKDYILYLNADEIIMENDLVAIENILKSSDLNAYNFRIQDCLGEWNGTEFSELNPNYSQSPQIRMFPNNSNIKFEGNVFENISSSLGKVTGYSICNSGITVYHHAFRGNPSKNRSLVEKYYSEIASSDGQKNILKKMENYSMDIPDEFSNEKCAIIIACYNIPSITKKCIESIETHTKYPYRLIIVDNGSDDRTVEYLKTLENAELICLGSNTGVAVARNTGIKRAMEMKDVKYICLLDNDTEVYSNWLCNMISILRSDSSYGMVGPFTNSATGAQNIVKTSWIGRYTSEEIISMVTKMGVSNCQSVNFLDRFCQVIPLSTITSIGLLEEGFGLIGMEDQDYSQRVANAGYKMAFCKKSFVYHRGHATCSYNSMSYFSILQGATRAYHAKWSERKIVDYGGKRNEMDVSGTSNPYTSIIVLTYNNLSINKRFVEAIEKYTVNYELIVVDNGSTDGTVKYLESLGNRIILVKNEKNLGVIKGRNMGLKLASHDYLVCLDNDQIVKENWLDCLHDEMRKGCDFVGVEAWQVNESYMPIKRHMSRTPGMRIDYVGAGGCLMKREVLEEIGLYDERFSPAYFEDVDICFRAREKGYAIGWCNRNIILHLEHCTLIKGQKDFNYNTAMQHSHGEIIKKMKDKKKGIKMNEAMLPSRKKVTFCMALKNRSERALKSIRSIINQEGSKNVEFIIVEDYGEDMLPLNIEGVTHIRVDTKQSWNKAVLINQIIPIIKTEYVCFWDADFIYPKDFLNRYFKLLKQNNFSKTFLQIMVTETKNSNKRGRIVAGGSLWGGFYTYKTSHFLGVNGFDESFVGWGYEDLDFNNRVTKLYGLVPNVIRIKDFVYHDSHDDAIRIMGNENINKKKMDLNMKLKTLVLPKPTILEKREI